MEQTKILSIIHKQIPESEIHSVSININQYNKQVDDIEIIMKPNVHTNLQSIGEIMDDIDSYTTDDGYGDLTECSMQFTTYHDLGDDLTDKITLTFNIDS